MSEAFESVVKLFAYAARGKEPEGIISADFKEVYRLAEEQSVWSVIYPLAKKLDEKGLFIIPDEYKQMVEMKYFRRYMFLNTRREFMRELFSKLNAAGVEFCLLKGDAIAQYYEEPLNKASSDVDIKIRPEDVEVCNRILKENNYTIEPLSPGMHHYECTHPVCGLLEVHVSFCMDITEDLCFKNAVAFDEDYRIENIEGLGEVNVMGYNDGLVYLLMHYIKHFISTGAGIRQLMDIILYYENNKNNIDHDKVREVVRGWGYEEFLDIIFAIGRKYLLSDEDFKAVESIKLEKVMSDIEKGGVFGYIDKDRLDFYNHYLKIKADAAGKSSKRTKKSLIHRLVPPEKELEIEYKYLEKCAALYPVALIHRAVDIIIGMRRRSVKIKQIDAGKVNERVDMLKDVGLL